MYIDIVVCVANIAVGVAYVADILYHGVKLTCKKSYLFWKGEYMSSILSLVRGISRKATNNAQLKIETAAGTTVTFVCQFNPDELSISTMGNFLEEKVQGKDSPIVQYMGGRSSTLNLKLFFDTSSSYEVKGALLTRPSRKSGSDVTEYTKTLMGLVYAEGKVHRPPQVTFQWGSLILMGFVKNVNTRYTMFETGGMPVRAEVQFSLLSLDALEIETEMLSPKESPDRTKCIVMTSDRSLWSIAQQEYGDTACWREIARANGIMEPLQVPAGTSLKVPALQK